jgi:hypothetical protein
MVLLSLWGTLSTKLERARDPESARKEILTNGHERLGISLEKLTNTGLSLISAVHHSLVQRGFARRVDIDHPLEDTR